MEETDICNIVTVKEKKFHFAYAARNIVGIHTVFYFSFHSNGFLLFKNVHVCCRGQGSQLLNLAAPFSAKDVLIRHERTLLTCGNCAQSESIASNKIKTFIVFI